MRLSTLLPFSLLLLAPMSAMGTKPPWEADLREQSQEFQVMEEKQLELQRKNAGVICNMRPSDIKIQHAYQLMRSIVDHVPLWNVPHLPRPTDQFQWIKRKLGSDINAVVDAIGARPPLQRDVLPNLLKRAIDQFYDDLHNCYSHLN
ncbi:hypothetical protein FRC03_000829 [Tulasnella sp. 419]|nr:hypothetical protein FRC03_000829 [Tulasnella sp. 419]